MIAHFACIYRLIASSEKSDKVFFGASFLICLAVIQLVKLVFAAVNLLKNFSVILLIPIAVKFCFSYSNVVKDNYESYTQVQQQYQQITEAKNYGQKKTSVKFFKRSKYLYSAYLGTANLNYSSDS